MEVKQNPFELWGLYAYLGPKLSKHPNWLITDPPSLPSPELITIDAVYKKGLIEWAMKQREQGVFKYIGFTGHSDPRPHIEMIRRGFEFDTVQCPVNIGDHHQEVSF